MKLSVFSRVQLAHLALAPVAVRATQSERP
jgi:hypothetical protein